MGFYEKHVLPIVLNLSCGTKVVQRQRQKVVPLAEGRVLAQAVKRMRFTVLPPDLDRRCRRQVAYGRGERAREVFLKSSSTSTLCAG